VKTLCCLTDDNTEVFISQEERDTEKQQIVWNAFQEMLQSHFEVTKIPEQEQHQDFCSPDIIVLRAMKRSLANKVHFT
jgi:aminopeptidase-like protein